MASRHAKAPSPLRSAGAVHKTRTGAGGFEESGGDKDSALHGAGGGGQRRESEPGRADGLGIVPDFTVTIHAGFRFELQSQRRF